MSGEAKGLAAWWSPHANVVTFVWPMPMSSVWTALIVVVTPSEVTEAAGTPVPNAKVFCSNTPVAAAVAVDSAWWSPSSTTKPAPRRAAPIMPPAPLPKSTTMAAWLPKASTYPGDEPACVVGSKQAKQSKQSKQSKSRSNNNPNGRRVSCAAVMCCPPPPPPPGRATRRARH